MNSDLHVRPPEYRRQEKLTEAQTIALTGAIRDALQRETSSAEEACSIALAVTATFCMDFNGDNVETMAKQLQEIKNRVVRDFRQGRFRMTRRVQE